MAPPIPRTRPPQAARSRTGRDVLLGLAAVAALLVLAAGVPIGLIAVFGSPIPHTLPTTASLSHQLDIATILKVLAVIVWLAWLQLVCCVVAEIIAAVRNTGMPASVPLAGSTQEVVHRLVATALLLATATAVLSPALAHRAPGAAPRPVAVATAPAARPATGVTAPVAQQDSREVVAAQVADRAAGAHAARVEKIYVVKPPVGRYHESLWEIADHHLGDGRRYREIFELNKDRIQPDGTKLTIASLIRPGWVLHMPRDAHGPGIEVVTPATAHLDQVGSAHGHSARDGSARDGWARDGSPRDGWAWDGLARDGSARDHGARDGSGLAPYAQDSSGPAQSGRPGQPVIPVISVSPRPTGDGHGVTFPDELAAAALLAAGVLSALGRRRREQLWQRAFGRQVAAPQESEAIAETALRLGAHEPSTRLLDTGLRHLSRALGAAGRTPPTVVAAHLGDDNLDLWVAPPDLNAPPPWTAADDGQVWRLPRAATDWMDAGQVADATAPFPGLVSIGTDSSGRVMVDLEAAHGLICLAGPPESVAAALAAIAVELATNCWSDQMAITLVGFGEDLVALAPDRITAVAGLADALPALEARAAQVADALAASGVGSVLTGRSHGINAEAWAPHYLIMATPPTPDEQRALLTLARVRHAAAAGYVVAGDIPGAAWTWHITAAGRLATGLLGLEVEAQVLPARQYAALAELFRSAGQADGVPLAPAPADAVPAAQLMPGARMAAEVTLLGPVSVQTAGVIEPDRIAQATELVTYLAAHPGGVHPTVLTGAIWPRGVSPEVRDAAVNRAAEWLGSGAAGAPLLLTDPAGRLRLSDEVRVDWQVFRALTGRAELARRAAASSAHGSTPEAAHGSTPEAALGSTPEATADSSPGAFGSAPGAFGGAHGAAPGGGPATPGPATPGPATPGPATPGPATPESAIPDPATPGAAEAGDLARALDLVTGQLLGGRDTGRYPWLATDPLLYEATARVADAAHRLFTLRLDSGDVLGAMDAARSGLRLAFDDELLWRDLLRGAHATGRDHLIRATVDEVCARTALDEVMPRMAPETEALIDEICPSWRASVA